MKQQVILLGVLALLLAATGVSGSEMRYDRPTIIKAELSVRDGLLMGDVTSSELFSERVTGTIQSGLPAVVELLYRLMSRERDTVTRGLHVFELRYDVWEDRYSIQDEDSTRHFSSLETMTRAVEHLRKIAIVPMATIDGGEEYAVEFGIAVHPLRSRDKIRIAGWVGEQVRGDGDESWHENVLNVNELISHFFSRNTDDENQSEWFQTEFFNPRQLPVRNGEVR